MIVIGDIYKIKEMYLKNLKTFPVKNNQTSIFSFFLNKIFSIFLKPITLISNHIIHAKTNFFIQKSIRLPTLANYRIGVAHSIKLNLIAILSNAPRGRFSTQCRVIIRNIL